MLGNEVRWPDRGHLTVSVGCVHRKHCDYITVELDVSQGRKLHFLVNSGAYISLVKSYTLLGSAESEPKDRVRIRSVEGSAIETHGSIETWIQEGGIQIPFCLQLVRQQVDLKRNWILGHHFLKLMQARIYYKE